MEYDIKDIIDTWSGKKYKSKQVFKRVVQKRIKPVYGAALEGKVDKWESSPPGRLALILLYDQAPRFLFNDKKMYSTDSKAQKLTTLFWKDESYLKLPPRQQMFAFFPYHHAENPIFQKRANNIFKKLATRSSEFDWIARSSDNYLEIIKKFGRFPHRNKILRRKSTHVELQFLRNK